MFIRKEIDRVDLMGKKTKVLLCCEFQMVTVGLTRFLSEFKQFQVSTLSYPQVDLVEQISQTTFDILLMDLSLLKRDSLKTLREIIKRDPTLKLLVISFNEKEPFISLCIDIGATGYISLHCNSEEFIEAIEQVSIGNKYLSKDVAYSFAITKLNNKDNIISSLTSREFEVFTRLSTGESVRNIAEDLCLSSKTIHVYRASILEKTKVSNTSELTLLAVREGLISLETTN